MIRAIPPDVAITSHSKMKKPGQMPCPKPPTECDVIVSSSASLEQCKYFFRETVAKLQLQDSRDKFQ